MQLSNRLPHCAVVALLSAPSLAAPQVEGPGRPALGLDLPLRAWVELPAPDVATLRSEDAQRGHVPLRYGTLQPTWIDLESDGQWDTAADGQAVWRVGIASAGAKSVGLEFAAFDLPAGAQLHAYDPARETVLGAFGQANETPSGGFVLRPVPGEAIVLELQLPEAYDEPPQLVVDRVIHDYRDVHALMQAEPRGFGGLGGDMLELTGGGGEGGCPFVDVNCPDGAPYELLKRATVQTLSAGNLCSGVLLNNTAVDGTPFLYTANHCATTGEIVVTFNHQTTGCGSGFAPLSQTVSGATLLAKNPASDGRLLRIDAPIPAGYDPYFAGWDRSQANPTSGVSMHHPDGGPKAVSIDSEGVSKETVDFGPLGLVKVWGVLFENGGTSTGSSGGPLQDQNGRIRGVLTGGNGCFEKFYGRLFNFWDTVDLAPHLDPVGTGALTLDGFDPGPVASLPVIDTLSPLVQQAVQPDGPPEVTVTGVGFTDVNAVSVSGQVVDPADWTVVDDLELRLTPAQHATVGTQTVTLASDSGSDTAEYSVGFNLGGPVLDLVDSDPGLLFTATGMTVYAGGFPGDVVYLMASVSNVPSVLPGVVSLDLGNNFLDVIDFPSKPVELTTGYAEWQIGLPPNVPMGLPVYLQGAVLSGILPTLPATSTNLESGTIAF